MPTQFANGDLRPDEKIEKLKSGGADHRDTQGGTYDVDPATAKDVGQGEYGGQPPEGLTRTRKGPLNPSGNPNRTVSQNDHRRQHDR